MKSEVTKAHVLVYLTSLLLTIAIVQLRICGSTELTGKLVFKQAVLSEIGTFRFSELSFITCAIKAASLLLGSC